MKSDNALFLFNPLTPDSSKYKIDKFLKLQTAQLNSFPTNGHTLGFCR